MVCVIQLPMDYKIFDIVKLIVFVLDDRLAFAIKITLVCAGCYCNFAAKCLICTVKTFQIFVLKQI